MLPIFNSGDLEKIATIVRKETGNEVKQKNFPMLESRMRTHLMKHGLKNMSEYWEYYTKNEDAEIENLKGLLTTHYTFFFREFAHFEILQIWIENNISRIKARYTEHGQPIRVWSAAASRGQEVYSLAIFLDTHLKKKYNIPYRVLGTDIDASSIKYAQNGVYPIKEVNTIPSVYLDQYWKKGSGQLKDYAAVIPDIRNNVQFSILNLIDVDKHQIKDTYDIIFCRNVFIYFSDEMVKKIALSLAGQLAPEGLFVSGVSESLRFPEWTLSAVGPSSYIKTAKGHEHSNHGARPSEVDSFASAHKNTYKVLCIDDSPTIQIMIKKIFSHDPNCESVDVCNNGLEAREKLDKTKYDLITLDIHMPIMGGIQFLEEKYNKKSDPPVIMISSVNRSDVDLATKAISLGAFDYVEKPALNNIKKSISEILAKAKMALKNDSLDSVNKSDNFSQSIGQKIVVPDASQCVRIILTHSTSQHQLEQVIKGQSNEARSPAIIVLESGSNMELHKKILKWTALKIIELKGDEKLFRPNCVYYGPLEKHKNLFAAINDKSVSLQILTEHDINSFKMPEAKKLQILVDESLIQQKENLEERLAREVSDITPATSFPSLSLEFFAHLRNSA